MVKANLISQPTKPLQLNEHCSAPALLGQIREDFGKIPDHRHGGQQFSLQDVLMSGLAVFGLKYPSLLKFAEQRHEERVRANLKSRYGVPQAPCDTQMRTVLDGVSPAELRAPFIHIHQQLQSQGVLEEYRYLGGFLVDLDGTGQFSSSKLSCADCCEKQHRHGEVEYYHQLLGAVIVHPDKSQVLPLFPEPITRQDGASKNDCESNASKRLLPALHEAFPQLPMIVVEDSLSADGPPIKLLKQHKYHYIIVVKPSDPPALFEAVYKRFNSGQYKEYEEAGEDGIVRGYRWMNGLPLNKSHPDSRVNYLDYWEIREGQEYNFSWITDLELCRDNVYFVMRGGRGRWKIENETFNTLKNQGYQLEHNYGHGQKYLATVFGMLMMLAFLVDQVQELCCSLFQAARQKFRSRTSLWDQLKGLFKEYFVVSWDTVWLAIIYGHKGGVLQPDTS
jgi:hypothetical protein